MSMSPRLLRPRQTGFDPRSIANLSLWLDASDSATLFDATSGGSAVAADGAVARWTDKSGATLEATQTTSNNRPLRKVSVQNGRDALRFDGSNDALQIASITLQTYVSAFVVSSTTRTGTNLKFWMEHNANVNSNDGFFFNGTVAGAWAFRRDGALHDGPVFAAEPNADWIGSGWALASLTYDGVGRVYKNGTLIYTQTNSGTARSNSNATAALNIGARNQASLFLTGDIGEILIYNRVLSDAERAAVHAGLNAKWKLY